MSAGDKIDKRIKMTISRSKHFRIARGVSKYDDNRYEYQILVDGINSMIIKIPKVKEGRYQIYIDFEIIKEKFDILYSLIKKYINEKDIIKKKKNIGITLSDTNDVFEHFIKALDEFVENSSHKEIELTDRDKLINKDIIQHHSDQYYKLEINKKGNTVNINQEFRVKGRVKKLDETINYDEYEGNDVHISTDDDRFKEGKQNIGMTIIDTAYNIIGESTIHNLEAGKQLALPPAEYETPSKDSQYSAPGEKLPDVLSKKLSELGYKNYGIVKGTIDLRVGSYLSYPITIPSDIRSARLYGYFIASSNIEVFIVDEYSFVNWKNSCQFSTYYFSGRVIRGNINANLPIGKSYIVYSNTFDISDKNVKTDVNIQYR